MYFTIDFNFNSVIIGMIKIIIGAVFYGSAKIRYIGAFK